MLEYLNIVKNMSARPFFGGFTFLLIIIIQLLVTKSNFFMDKVRYQGFNLSLSKSKLVKN